MTHLHFITPDGLHQTAGYTHLVRVEGDTLLFISGQVALDADGNLVGQGNMCAQLRQVIENIQTALEAAGASFEHVVKLGIYTVDIEALLACRDIRDEYVNTDNPPASTAVEVSRLFRPDVLVEIEAVAVLPPTSV